METFYLQHTNGTVEERQGIFSGLINTPDSFAAQFGAKSITKEEYDSQLKNLQSIQNGINKTKELEEEARIEEALVKNERKVTLLVKMGLTDEEAEEFLEL